jgi:hypothetical protein
MKWTSYFIAACLMLLGIFQLQQIIALKTELKTSLADAAHLRASNAYVGLCLTMLEPKDAAQDPSYATSKIMVAWDPNEDRGVVSPQGLPTAPSGHDYQLWVLDPNAEAPINAGVFTGPRPFTVKAPSMADPGFAVSLEPGGGSPLPAGPILFAVAPGS